MRPVFAFLAIWLSALVAHAIPTTVERTAELRAFLTAALGQPPEDALPYSILGLALADYASRTPGEPTRFETFPAAARRLLASGPVPSPQPPDRTALQLRRTADDLLTSLPSGPASDSAILDARLTAQLARVHAHRMLAAVH